MDPTILAIFGPVGIALGLAAWLAMNVYKLMNSVEAEVNHNSGTSIKDMLNDQREYTRDQLELMRVLSSNQREIKDLLREEHEAASEYRLWASHRIEEQAETLDRLDRS